MSESKEKKQKLDDIESLDDTEVTGDINIRTNDGKEYKIPKKFAFISGLIKAAIEKDTETKNLDINVSDNSFKHIYQYMLHHEGIEQNTIKQPLESENLADSCSYKWDAEFIEPIAESKTRQDIIDMMNAANYLDIKGLLQLSCARFACFMKNKTLAQQPRALFKGIFTDEEINQYLKDNNMYE